MMTGIKPYFCSLPKLNAWYQKCSIKGASTGILAGKRIAIKDNVCVAGVPMMNGSSVLEGYVNEPASLASMGNHIWRVREESMTENSS
jgi:hypothetical protein